MTHMKHLLKLLAASVFTTCAATSVLAHSPHVVAIASLNDRVAQDLGLLDKEGKSTQNVTLHIDVEGWEIPASTDEGKVTAASLLKENNVAKSEQSYNFIIQSLGIQPEKEGKWDEAEFKKTDLAVFEAVIIKIKPTLAPTTKKDDYVVTGGTFNLIFKKDDILYTEEYTLPLKADNKTGIIAGGKVFPLIAQSIKIGDTDVVEAVNFKVGRVAPREDKIQQGMEIALTGDSPAVVEIRRLKDLLGTTITVQTVTAKITGQGHKWAKGDTLTLKYCTDVVTFFVTTTLKLEG